MNIVDNVTKKLQGIFSMLGGEGGFARLSAFDSPRIRGQIRNLGRSISSVFRSDDNKTWFEKTVGYFKTATKQAIKIGDALVGAFALGGAAMTAGIVVASAFLTRQLIRINSEMEQFEVSLKTTLGSLTAAKKEMAGIVQFAKETPYQIRQITDAVVRLRAYSMDADKWLEPLGNAASAFGRDITDAVEMAADAQMGMFRRALSYGIRGEDVRNIAKQAGIPFGDALLQVINERFEGGMLLQSKTLRGIWSNIQDSLYISFYEATKPIYGIIKQQIQILFDYLGSKEGQTRLQQLVNVMTDMLGRIISAAKAAFTYIQTNIVPVAQTTGKAMLGVFSAIVEMMQPLSTVLQPLLVALASILQALSWIITQSKLAIQIFVAFSIAIKIMGLLGFSVRALAANMVATNKAATMLGATIKTLGITISIAAASFAAMWVIGNYMEIRNNLRSIGNEIHNVATSAEEVRDYLKEIGVETGNSLKEMTKIALAAKEFGHNMPNVIAVASKLAGEAKEGYAKTLGDFGIEEAAITEAVGRLAEAFKKEGDSFEQMAAKTEAAGAMLNHLHNISEITGITFDDLAIAIESNRDVLAKYADNVGELTYLIAEFGKVAKQAGMEVNVGKFLETLGMLLAPTKEMLLTLPVDTWIAKPLKDMDIDAISQTLSEALDVNDIIAGLSKIEGASAKIIDASAITRNNLEEGADKLREAAEMVASVQGGGPGMPQVRELGTGGKIRDWVGTTEGTITSLVAIVMGAVTTTYLTRKLYRNLDRSILGDVAGRAGFGNLAVRMNERFFTKNLGKGFADDVVKATEIQTAKLTKVYDKQIVSIEKELKNVTQKLEQGQINILRKGGFGGTLAAIPEGMSVSEFVSKFPKEAFKQMTSEQLKVFRTWEAAFLNKRLELEAKLASTRIEAATAIEKMKTSYQELASAVKKGRVPMAMHSLAEEIQGLSKTVSAEATAIGKVRKKQAAAAVKDVKASPEVTKFGRVFGTFFLNLLDIKAFQKLSDPARKGVSLRTTRSAAVGYERIAGDILATRSVDQAQGRFLALTVQPYFAKLQYRLRKAVTGERGAISIGPLEKMLNKLGVTTNDAASQYAKAMKEAEGAFRKISFPHDVKVILNDLGAKPTKVFTKMVNSLEEIQFRASNWYGFTPSAGTLKKAGITGEMVNLAPLKQVIDYDIYTSKTLLSTVRGLSLFMHELGHAATAQTKVGLGLMQEKARFGGQGFVTPEVLAEEKAAWEAGRKFLIEAKVGVKTLTEYNKVMAESLKTYSDMATYLERDARGRFVRGNRFQWTAETAPRMFGATETFREFFAKTRGVLPKADSRIMFENLARERVQRVKVVDDTSSISKNLKHLNKALTGVLLYQIAGEIGKAVLVPHLERLKAEGRPGAAVGLKAWEITFSEPAMKAAYGALSAWFVADMTKAVAMGAKEGRALGGTLGAVRGGLVAGAHRSIITVGALMAFERWVDVITKGPEPETYRSYTGEEFRVDTGEPWSARSIGLDLLLNLGKVGNPAVRVLKSIVDIIASIPERMGGLFVGGWGRTGAGAANVTDMTEQIYGRDSDFARREKQIEDAYRKNRDAAIREAGHEILLREKVEQKVEFLAARRGAVLGILTERIKEQYTILEEAGKAVPQTLIDELARAGEWVKNNITWGTDIATQLADGTFVLKDSIVDDFESAGKLAADAFSAIAGKELAKYDLGSAVGIEKFLEDMDAGNISEEFKKLFDGVSAGQVALTLMIEALKKLDEQAKVVQEGIDKLNSGIAMLTTEISALEHTLNRASQALENVSSAFDLAIATNELVLVSDRAQTLEVDIANLNAELARSEMEMLPLQRALDGVQKEFDAIQDAIDKTQQKLDAFMNAPVEGERTYREQRYQLERQIAQKQHELDQAQRTVDVFPEGLTGSDVYKAASARVTVLTDDLAKLKNQLDDLSFARENITAPVEHAKDMAGLATEQAAQAIIEGIKLESDKLAILQQQYAERQNELTLAQALVDKKQEENDKISDAINWRAKELELVEKQVEASNALVEAAKKRAEFEGKVKELKGKIVDANMSILGIEGLITAQKLIQTAQDYAAGIHSKEQLDTMVKMYNQVAGLVADVTGQKALKEFDVSDYQQDLVRETEKHSALIARQNEITKAANEMIEGVDTTALSKADLESLFGPNVGSLISHMNTNIGSMEKNIAALAAGRDGAIPSYAAGGIELAKERLVKLHGPEAVIPLQNGSVPVTLYGAQQRDATIVNNTTVEVGSIVVRDNDDLEEVKRAILALRQGQTNFFSRAAQYPERF